MRLIGMTGRSGCGKSTVSTVAESLGILVLDCDGIYREMTSRPSDCLRAIRETFGDETVKDGALYRPALREKVFCDPGEMAKLNEITSRYMTQEILSRLQGASAEIAILDAPTLFESGMQSMCNDLLCITAPEEACIQRIMLRDQISREDALLRLRSQRPDSFFTENCNLHLHNDGDLEAFCSAAHALLSAIQKGEI